MLHLFLTWPPGFESASAKVGSYDAGPNAFCTGNLKVESTEYPRPFPKSIEAGFVSPSTLSRMCQELGVWMDVSSWYDD